MSTKAKIERYKANIARDIDARETVKVWAIASIITTIALAMNWYWQVSLALAAVLFIVNVIANYSIEKQTKRLWQLDKKAVLSIARNIGVTKLSVHGEFREKILDEMITEESR